jgi:hypothetical protein
MKIESRAHPNRKILHASYFLLALLLAPTGESLAQVTHVTVAKYIEHVQTSATTVIVNPDPQGPTYGGPYGFGVNVEGTNIAGITPPRIVSGPINIPSLGSFWNGGNLVYNTGDAIWRTGFPNGNDWGSPTMSDRDAHWGSGTYTLLVNGATVPLVLTGDGYPNAPVLTLTGGAWANGKYVVDPSRPITITTNAFTAYGSNINGVIGLGIEGIGFDIQGHDFVASPNFLSKTVPANTFTNGQEFHVYAVFSSVIDLKPNGGLQNSYNSARYEKSTSVIVKAETPIFPMVVTGSIGPTVSNITATIQYRPQDVGSSGSVYTFAVAPQTLVLPALLKSGDTLLPPLGYAKRADGSKDTAVACVLSQLTASGQLQAVSASGLAAFVSGVLGSQGQAVAVINGVATVNIAGATFYVGYGTSAQSMLSNGINRNVVAVPGSLECKPQAPQAGWWWNPTEGGRGYSLESQGNHIFYAAFLYDDAGRSNWYVATGSTSIDGSLFTGDLLKVANGQALGGPYKAPTAAQSVGPFTLAFSDNMRGTMVWPGGTVAIERFNIVTNGLQAAKRLNQPETGWWWNPAESGRGFFIEWQDGFADLAGYMYDDNGNPVWYLSVQPTPNMRAFSGNWWLYANGQSLTGAYKPATQLTNTFAPVSINFTSETTAIMTLPNGRTTNLQRHRF